MNGKKISKKLKIVLTGIGIIGASYFNANAQDYKAKYNTIAHKMLMIEDSTDNIPLNTYPNLKTLDALIDNSTNYIPKKENYTKQEITEISQNIYSDILKEDSNFLETKDRCHRLSALYLAIAKTNNLPLYAVITAKHMFVRYDPDGKHDALNPENLVNKDDINIETVTGKIQKDQFYLSPLISKKSLEKGIYMKNLNEKEFLSTIYYNMAVAKGRKKDYQEALKECNKAIKLNPNLIQAYTLKAEVYDNLNEFEKAIQFFNKAIELNPEPRIYFKKANVLLLSKKYEEALMNYNQAVDLSIQIIENEKNSLRKASFINSAVDYLKIRSKFYSGLGKELESKRDLISIKILRQYSP